MPPCDSSMPPAMAAEITKRKTPQIDRAYLKGSVALWVLEPEKKPGRLSSGPASVTVNIPR